MNKLSLDISKRLDLFVRKGQAINKDITVNSNGLPYDFTGLTATMEVFAGSADTVPNLVFDVVLTPGNINVQLPANKVRKNASFIWMLKVNGVLWLNGMFTINEGVWDGLNESTEELTVNLNTSPIVLNFTGGAGKDHFKGEYPNEAALAAAWPDADPGDYANVDAGPADDAVRYIWDDNGGYWINTGQTVTADKFTSDFVVVLSGGKSFGRFTNGQTVPANTKTAREVILLAAIEYIAPAWGSFVLSQASTVEVGTTVAGNKNATWSITPNSGVVNFIDIVDVTGATNLATNTPNDGAEVVALGSYQLNADGATRSYRGVLKDANNGNATLNSALYSIVARFYRFFGAVAVVPPDSTAVRALSSAFQSGPATFDLDTGTVQTTFVVYLPPGKTIQSVVDLDALNVDLTAQYVLQGTFNVQDAGSTNRAYNFYKMTIGVPYGTSHRHHVITN